MKFFELILLLVIIGAVSSLIYYLFKYSYVGDKKFKLNSLEKDRAPALVGVSVMLIAYVLLLSVRSLDFGVDTVTYASLFHDFCSGEKDLGNDSSFIYSLNWLNFFMLGACEVKFLPIAWGIAFLLPLFFIKIKFEFKIYFLALLLFSIIGVEFTTNALRQAFSVGFLVVSISYLNKRIFIASILLIVSILFHSSSFLIFLMYFITRFSRKSFYLLFFSTLFFVYTAINLDIDIPIISKFMYEINKYLLHDGDEIFIRVFAFSSLISLYIFSIRSVKFYSDDSVQFRLKALRLCLLCIPFLWLPYFGYRIVYGAYPVVLFLIMKDIGARKNVEGNEFIFMLISNIFMTLIWGIGSAHMRNIDFI